MTPGTSHFQNVPANDAPVAAAATASRRSRLADGADQENRSIQLFMDNSLTVLSFVNTAA
jgi:hypothetical protein